MRAVGVRAMGVKAVGVKVVGVRAVGVKAMGVNALGVRAVGVKAVGVRAMGVRAVSVGQQGCHGLAWQREAGLHVCRGVIGTVAWCFKGARRILLAGWGLGRPGQSLQLSNELCMWARGMRQAQRGWLAPTRERPGYEPGSFPSI